MFLFLLGYEKIHFYFSNPRCVYKVTEGLKRLSTLKHTNLKCVKICSNVFQSIKINIYSKHNVIHFYPVWCWMLPEAKKIKYLKKQRVKKTQAFVFYASQSWIQSQLSWKILCKISTNSFLNIQLKIWRNWRISWKHSVWTWKHFFRILPSFPEGLGSSCFKASSLDGATSRGNGRSNQ